MVNYGLIGLFLIVFNIFTLFLKIHPFDYWYNATNWLGFILFLDYLIYKKKGNSLLHNPILAVQTFILSIILWLVVDLYNFLLSQNWYYVNFPYPEFLFFMIIISEILPSIVESVEFANLYFPFKIKIRKINISKKIVFILFSLSMIFIFIVTFWELFELTVPILLVSLFLFSDSLNFLLKKKSFIGDLSNGNLTRLISSLIGGYIVGIYWELFNLKLVNWVYNIIPAFDYIFPYLNLSLLRIPSHIWIGCAIGYVGFYSMFLLIQNILKNNKEG